MKNENSKVKIKTVNDNNWTFPENIGGNGMGMKFDSHRGHAHRCYRIHNFFKKCQEPNAVYLRFDDDICFIEENAIKEILEFRVNNPEYFLVYPLIINNPFLNYTLRHKDVFKLESLDECMYEWNCINCFYKGRAICDIHNQFIEDVKNKDLEKYKIGKIELKEHERVLINCISWFGSDMARIRGRLGHDEEKELTVEIPKKLEKINCVFAGPIVSHFSSFYQRMNPTEDLDLIWEKYENLII
jgi:hypothetical protein